MPREILGLCFGGEREIGEVFGVLGWVGGKLGVEFSDVGVWGSVGGGWNGMCSVTSHLSSV